MIENIHTQQLKQEEEDIAIIGVGIRLPGDSNDLDQFWNLLVNKINGVKELDPERWSPSFYQNGDFDNNRMGTINWMDFDPLFFGISPKDTAAIDPQQRLLLKIAWETFEDAGLDPFKLKASITAQQFTVEQKFDASYIYNNIILPVQFQQTLNNIYKYISQDSNLSSNNITFIEIAPHPVLSYYIKKSIPSNLTQTIIFNPLNKKSSENELQQFRKTIIPMYVNGRSSQLDFTSQFSTQEKQDCPTTESSQSESPENSWVKSCIGKISVVPHDKELVNAKENIEDLFNNYQYYFTSPSKEELYKSLLINTKIAYGPHFQRVIEIKYAPDFLIAKVNIDDPISVFDGSSFFNAAIIDNIHVMLSNKNFPNGCILKGIEDLQYFSSNIPLNKSEYKYIYIKGTYLKLDGDTFKGSFKVFLPDGTVLFQCSNSKIASFKKVEDTCTIKHPTNDIYSSFWQPKDSDLVLQPTYNTTTTGVIINESNVLKLLLESIRERVPHLRTEMIQTLSLLELELYLSNPKLKIYFRNVFQILKENLPLILENELGNMEDPDLIESISIVSEVLFGSSGAPFQKIIDWPFRNQLQTLSKSIGESVKVMIQSKEKRLFRILELGPKSIILSKYLVEELYQIIQEQQQQDHCCNIEIEFTSMSAGVSQILDQYTSRYISIVHKTIDLDSDLQKQNIKNGFYDCVVMFLALNSVNSSESLLGGIFKALKPNGQLIFIETNKTKNCLQDILLGPFHQWLEFKPRDPEYWETELKKTGFENTAISLNIEKLVKSLMITTSKPGIKHLSTIPSAQYQQCIIYISTSSVYNNFTTELKQFYLKISKSVQIIDSIYEFSQLTLGPQDIIIFSKGMEPLSQDNFIKADMEFTKINQFLYDRRLSTKLILLTMGAQLESPNYLNSSLIGIFRSFTEFNQLLLYSVDINITSLDQEEMKIIQTIEYICNPKHFIDREFVITKDQKVLVEIWKRENQKTSLKTSSYENQELAYTIDYNLVPQLIPIQNTLQPGQVLVRVKSIGFNFKDTLYYSQILKSQIGLEFSGDIIKIGASVSKLKKLTNAISDGKLGIIPIDQYQINDFKLAYKTLTERKNMGKVVISDPDENILLQMIQNQTNGKSFILKNNYSINPYHLGKTVLVTGQSGSIFEVIQWMVKYCKEGVDIIVLSQSPIKYELEFIQKQLIFNNQPSRIHFRRVDISNLDSVRNAINGIFISSPIKTISPIESVFHFAFGLADCLPDNITIDNFKFGHSAKTFGALNLHYLSLELKWNLKHFIMCSSIVSVLGSPNQCVYLSSNAIINSLSNYRRSIGLPSSTLLWGPLSVGVIKNSAGGDIIAKKYEIVGYGFLSPQKIKGTMDLLIQNPQQHLIVSKINKVAGEQSSN
eukprot:gene5566-6932_t